MAMTSPSRVVVDTSALLDAVDQDHPAWGEALFRLGESGTFLAPAILASEAGNVVHRKRPGDFGVSTERRAELLETLLSLVDLVPSDPHARRRAAVLVQRHRLSFYDAEFLELAARHPVAILVTHDARLLAAARDALGPERAFRLDDAPRSAPG